MIPILNEKKYVEDIINSSTMPEKMSVNMMITYLTKYYYINSSSVSEVVEKVCNQMDKFNIDIRYYQEYKCKNRVEKIYKAIVDGKVELLKECSNIPLYKSEYDKIMACENDKEKKFLFTIYILARYTDRYGWVYNPRNEMFKLANISSTTKGYKEIIFNLLRSGYIKNTNKVDDVKIGVDLGDTSEDIVLEVSGINNLGNQFMAFIKDGYKLCEVCGRLIKIKSLKDQRSKYCKKCAEEVDRNKAKERMKALRN
jgi:hypothetical protein